MNKIKDSENLALAISALRRGEGIVLAQTDGARLCLYPAEFLHKSENISDNKTAIALAKRAGILPIIAIVPESNATQSWQVFSETALETAIQAKPQLMETARANLPIDGAENSKLITFRVLGDEAVHLALVIGKPKDKQKVPLVRVHSSCVTGDLLGSLRCDCGDQLKLALSAIKAEGYGVLLYLNQEGRGIGISNKIRAYGLQEQGMDTYEANHALGFDGDERDFAVAAEMLKSMGFHKIRLLSNNPHKVESISEHSIEIIERKPLISEKHSHNQNYLDAKASKAGHIF